MKYTLEAIILFATVLLCTIKPSHSDCCHVPIKCNESNKTVERCYDCTEVAGYYCGVGGCNVFGCNCDGGCRQGNASLWCWNIVSDCRAAFFTEAVTINNNVFYSADANADGIVSFDEARDYISHQRVAGSVNDVDAEILKLDTNGDGYLSPNEIDKSLQF